VTVAAVDSGGLRARFRTRIPRAWRTPLGITGAVVAALWILIAVLGPLLWPHNPLGQDFPRLQAPSGAHWFGTDELGRDVLSRVLAGARVTVPLALLLVGLSVVIGGILGLAAGFFGRWVDETVMRLTDLVFCFPPIILAMAIAAALGIGTVNTVIAMLVVWWPKFARLSRSLVISQRSMEYVEAAQSIGFGPAHILLRQIIPNAVGPLIVLVTLDLGNAILVFAGLSFLGLGTVPPTPEWGSMVGEGRELVQQWWVATFPGLAILTVVMAFNFMGDGFRDWLDPHANRR